MDNYNDSFKVCFPTLIQLILVENMGSRRIIKNNFIKINFLFLIVIKIKILLFIFKIIK